jgi:predicted RNase H-like nuclease (RuvC/YqgF family)
LDKREFRNNLRKIREQDLEIRRNKSKIDALEKIVIEQENEIQELSRKIERQNMMIRTQEAANNQQREDIKDQEDMFSLFSNL